MVLGYFRLVVYILRGALSLSYVRQKFAGVLYTIPSGIGPSILFVIVLIFLTLVPLIKETGATLVWSSVIVFL